MVFKECQNRGVAEFGRDLWRKSSPSPLCLGQGHLEQVAQSCVLLGLNIPKNGESTTSLSSLLLLNLVQSNCTNSVDYMEDD